LVIAIISIFFVLFQIDFDPKSLETNLLQVREPVKTDLVLGDIEVKSEEKGDLVSFSADLEVINLASNLSSADFFVRENVSEKFQRVVLDEKFDSGQTVLIKNFEFSLPNTANILDLEFEIVVNSDLDIDESSNKKNYTVGFLPSKLQNFTLKPLNRYQAEVSFDTDSFALKNSPLTLWKYTGQMEIPAVYRELSDRNGVSSYYTAELSKEIVEEFKNGSFEEVQKVTLGEKVNTKDFSQTDTYFMLSSRNENGSTAFSDVLIFSENKPLTNEKFAKVFLEIIDEEVEETTDFEFIKDLDPKYGKYVKRLFNLGLLGDTSDLINYKPKEFVTRAEVTKIVLDYLRADLIIRSANGSFKDVDADSLFLPYLNSLKSRDSQEVLGQYFHPESPADIDFLTFVINAY
jgi:hypothetical protein